MKLKDRVNETEKIVKITSTSFKDYKQECKKEIEKLEKQLENTMLSKEDRVIKNLMIQEHKYFIENDKWLHNTIPFWERVDNKLINKETGRELA